MKFTLKETNFSGLGRKKKGKVRDVYAADDKRAMGFCFREIIKVI